MKSILTLSIYLFLFLFYNFIYPQNFSWEIEDTLISATTNQVDLTIHTLLFNNTSDPIHLRVIRLINPDINGWSTSLCVGTLCAAPWIDTMEAHIPGNGLDSLILHVNTGPDPAEGTLSIRVENMEKSGEFLLHNFHINAQVTSIETSKKIPGSFFTLYPNFPNPFNPSTTINFTIDVNREIRTQLVVFNQVGQKIRALVDAELYPGFHSFLWDGKNSRGNSVSSGSYFYELRVGNQVLTRRMILTK
jgi:hypothetical protein